MNPLHDLATWFVEEYRNACKRIGDATAALLDPAVQEMRALYVKARTRLLGPEAA